MIISGQEDIDKLKDIGGICRKILDHMGSLVKPGVTPRELDQMAGEMMRDMGARSAPILTYDFPGHTCISVGDAVAHGIPDDIPMQEGQLVNIDVSAEKDGYYGDCGASFGVGRITPDLVSLLKSTRITQYKAMMSIRAGQPYNCVGKVVEAEAKKRGYKIIDGLNGHGVGRWIHEDPTISNKYEKNIRGVFEKGMVVAIEPFLATKSDGYVEDSDGWTLRLNKGGHGAQFENSIIVTDAAPIIITS